MTAVLKTLREILNVVVTLSVAYSAIIIIIPIFILNIFVRFVVWILARFLRPDLHDFVTNEHSSYAFESSSGARLNVVAGPVFEGDVSLESLKIAAQKNVFEADKSGEYSGLKRTWTSFMGWAFWKVDREFDLKNHIRNYDKEENEKPYRYREELGQLIGRIIQAPWNKDRSPWEIVRIPMKNQNGCTFTTCAMRWDHVLGDGYSVVGFLSKLLKTKFPMPNPKFGKINLNTMERLALLPKILYDTVEANSSLIFGGGTLPQKKEMTLENVVSLSPMVNVEMIKKIKNHFQVNYAAVLYAAIFGALQHALQVSQQEIPDELVCAFTAPRLKPPRGMGFSATVLLSKFPIKNDCPIRRLMKIQEKFQKVGSSTAGLGAAYVANVFGYFPMFVRKILTEWTLNSNLAVVCSNFPVSLGPSYFQGCPMEEVLFNFSTVPPAGIFIITGGVNNKQGINVTMNKTLLLSSEAMECFGLYVDAELRILMDSAIAT